ncbi:MAG: GNAT family N-acetyltransferase [Deltaproteobacteria bacterium]|nr:GNAT family N-acetyltransferase [Deltaproteobacteria bacterium]MBW2051533.1 GNAT family N-acetyltransferase [Deltaproteobacteria bacterium]MBW2139723.1 GNAT family N-acetyltransferase [Deltaproteobacteria bacterium]MBW2322522.1 GNAT family N-acetyltransferase [Deltaproteobacteria bacterium]
MIKLIQSETGDHFKQAHQLFKQYAASLDFDLCFQDFEDELASLDRIYGPPNGCLLLSSCHGQLSGCVALRRLEKDICEMKRLYVKPQFRGLGLGKALAEAIIRQAIDIGYSRMRLDTVPSMKGAGRLYKSLGFIEVEAYRYNPIEGAVYMELDLT